MKRFRMVILASVVFLFSGCTSASNDNNMDCTKVSNNQNGKLSGTVSCTFTSFTGEKQVVFGLKNKPKPESLSIRYDAEVDKGTVSAQLEDDAGTVYFEKDVASGNNEKTIDLNLGETNELVLHFKGTKATGTLNFNW